MDFRGSGPDLIISFDKVERVDLKGASLSYYESSENKRRKINNDPSEIRAIDAVCCSPTCCCIPV